MKVLIRMIALTGLLLLLLVAARNGYLPTELKTALAVIATLIIIVLMFFWLLFSAPWWLSLLTILSLCSGLVYFFDHYTVIVAQHTVEAEPTIQPIPKLFKE